MGELALFLAVIAVLVLVPVGYARLGIRARRRGIDGSVMAPFEEIWDPRAHGTHIEVHVQPERRAEAPAPGDPPTARAGRTRL